MPRIATRHAHKLAYRRRFSLGLRMLGCLVMLAGAIVLAAALAELVKGPSSQSLALTISLGVVLFTGGAVFFCGERGKMLDRQHRTLTCWWGVVFPLIRTCYELQFYQAVGVLTFVDAGVSRWRVCLWSAQSERLDLFDLPSEDLAQLAARQVAMFLSLALAPTTVASDAPP